MAQEDWDKIRKGATSPDRPDDWPEHVRAISMKGLALFGVHDQTQEIYWDGNKLAVERKVSLEGWTLALAFIATGATVVAAVWPIALHFGFFAASSGP